MARMVMREARTYVTVAGLCAACTPGLDGDPFELSAGTGVEPGRARCEASLAPTDVRGDGTMSPLVGKSVDVAGVVTLPLPAREPPGFFMQSLPRHEGERSAAGLFVALPVQQLPPAGRLVRVRGTVDDVEGMTQLRAIERLDECGELELTPEILDLRELEVGEAVQSWNGAWLRAVADWAVLDVSDVLDDGSVLASPRGRLYASGHELGSGVAAAERWTILPAAPHPDTPGASPRLGATRSELVGVLQVSNGVRRLHTAEHETWSSERPTAPARAPGTSVRVVSLNLDNYFLDLEGPGARSEDELSRQRDKLVAALVALDADILALTELENRGTASLSHLLAGLDAALDPMLRYTFSETLPPGLATSRAGIAHRPTRVRSRAEAWFDERPGFRRAPLFQSFEAPGYRFTLGVVHLKSKRCDGQPEIISDEGCGAPVRAEEAALLIEGAEDLAASDPLEPLLLLGDFNGDSLEAPLLALRDGGFVDLLDILPAAARYSYVFEGRASLLDHALARNGAARLARGAAIWHINADEPFFRGYSLDNPSTEYHPDARRSSDHDPIIVDLGL